ncbi:MAG: HD domain-containing protein [Myxococcaceae bacterium]|nr:HD domain-containing protein [Myxococcaceae bacterium]
MGSRPSPNLCGSLHATSLARVRFVAVGLMLVSCAHVSVAPRADVVALMERHVTPGGVNHQHMLRLARLVPRFSDAEGARREVVEAAVLLHDATKERGEGTPFERFCTHGTQAAALARRELPSLGFSREDAEAVSAAIEQHMGPLGDNAEFGRPRFMSGFCRRDFPAPATNEARVVFDLDMLDLMTVDGVVKVVTLRQTKPEFEHEALRESAMTGSDSALKSVVDARQVLKTKTGQACGGAVEAHTRRFLSQVDFETVTSVDTFSSAAAAFLTREPLPACVRP